MVVVESVSFVHDHALFALQNLNTPVDATDPVDAYTHPGATRLYAYRLAPLPAQRHACMQSKQLGKLDIAWRTRMGGSGRLQTSQVARKVPPPPALSLAALECPRAAPIETQVRMRVQVRNGSDRKMSLRLFLSRAGVRSGILLSGVSGQYVGDLDAGMCDGGRMCVRPSDMHAAYHMYI